MRAIMVVFIEAASSFKCSLDNVKRSFYRKMKIVIKKCLFLYNYFHLASVCCVSSTEYSVKKRLAY